MLTGMPVLFFLVLFINRKVLREGRSNALAKSTMFLTGGYKQHVYFWEAPHARNHTLTTLLNTRR